MKHLQLCTSIVLALAATVSYAQPAPVDIALTTHAERTGFTKTGRYDEVVALCDAFAARYPQAVRCETFGTTPERRPMKLLVVSTSGALTIEAARERKLPVTLIQGGIHAGEIDGKDAGFLAVRELLEGRAGKGVLDRQVLLFVPVFNIDGHEIFDRWNRPNQRGPEEMGWRTTAQNYNLNRDYAKAETPEMQAMLALINAWDPLAYVDLHVTNGAKFEHDISIQVEPINSGDPALRASGLALRDGVIARLAKQGSLPLSFYPSFVENDDPTSGFEDSVAPPRFSQGYIHLRNRFGMLVETHSWRPYAHRVRATRNTIMAVLDLVGRNGRKWREQTDAADERARRIAGQPVALEYKASDKARTIRFRGYEYARTPSEVSGALMTRYDETRPQVWRVPLKDVIEPARVVKAPGAGYLVPAAHAAWVGEKLRQHAIEFRQLPSALTSAPAEAFLAQKATFAPAPFEGNQRVTLEGQWSAGTHNVGAGALFVPIAQPKARLVMALLEPQAPDALAGWGRFNNAFERKEYMEDYVAEEVAREMLARDPDVRARFEKRLAEDTAFAASPQARLEFFHRLHSSWDARYNLYPVLRVDQAPAP
ncbi:MAG: Gll2474 protein [uncultured Lysobacter sp.]|uniref:Gll2474 protein n=1 Tax=uncultured Lysobacter sp. TaxID=271060 RepID=A0A6J4L2J9_9GAMM|nr:MAG: Gll2474 protein [uncultured Lysobacter sp.]